MFCNINIVNDESRNFFTKPTVFIRKINLIKSILTFIIVQYQMFSVERELNRTLFF